MGRKTTFHRIRNQLSGTRRDTSREKSAGRGGGLQTVSQRQKEAPRTGWMPILGPIRYPLGPKAREKSDRAREVKPGAILGGSGIGGLPPELRLPPPPSPFAAKASKRQTKMLSTPPSRLADEEYKGASKAVDLLRRMEIRSGARTCRAISSLMKKQRSMRGKERQSE